MLFIIKADIETLNIIEVLNGTARTKSEKLDRWRDLKKSIKYFVFKT